MSFYECDLCSRTYKYEKNLKRHVREKHTTIEYWLCVQGDCVSKFVRRSYLSKHLVLKHGFNKLEAHETACKAPRGDIHSETYYDKVSEDDTILDLIEEMDEAQYGERYVDTISNFNVTDYNNNVIGDNSGNSADDTMKGDAAIGSDAVLVGSGPYSDITESEYSDVELSDADSEIENNKVVSSGVLSSDDAVCDNSNKEIYNGELVNRNNDVIPTYKAVSDITTCNYSDQEVYSDGGVLNKNDGLISGDDSDSLCTLLDYYDEEVNDDEVIASDTVITCDAVNDSEMFNDCS